MSGLIDLGRKVVLAVVVLTLAVAPTWAQSDGAIRGEVTASADNSALSGATVTLGSVTASADPMSMTTDDLVAKASFGADLHRHVRRWSRLSLRIDVENITISIYLIAQEDAEFSPGLGSNPRLISLTAKVHF